MRVQKVVAALAQGLAQKLSVERLHRWVLMRADRLQRPRPLGRNRLTAAADAPTSCPMVTLPGAIPWVSPIETWMAGAIWTTTSSVSSRSVSAPVGQTRVHCTQNEQAARSRLKPKNGANFLSKPD